MDIAARDLLDREIVDIAAYNPVMALTPDDIWLEDAYREIDSLSDDSQTYSEDMRFWLDEPSHLATEHIGNEGMGLTTIYSREMPYMGYFQNGMTWYMPETEKETGEFHRIRTNLVTNIIPLLFTAEEGKNERFLAGWYLITTASEHRYLVFYSPQNPEYIPLRPNPPVLVQ